MASVVLSPTNAASVGGAANSWANPTNTAASDDVYADMNLAFLAADNDYLDMHYTASLPGGSTIDGYEVSFERRYAGGTGAFPTDETIQLLSASATPAGENKAAGLQWNSNQSLQLYGGATDKWGTSFTSAQVNTFIGVRMRAGSDASGRRLLADHVTLTIFYAEGGGETVTKTAAAGCSAGVGDIGAGC